MQIKNSKFVTSFASAESYTKSNYNNEFCFLGRSNVGKSTLINTLCNAKIARTSQTPGRTRLINIFDINSGYFTLVDLPGYGFAKAGHADRIAWQTLAEGYFTQTKNLRRAFVLSDIRVHSPLDQQMLDYLYFNQIPFSIIATKCDKVAPSQLPKAVIELAAFLKVGKDNIVTVSNKGKGKAEVLKIIQDAISTFEQMKDLEFDDEDDDDDDDDDEDEDEDEDEADTRCDCDKGENECKTNQPKPKKSSQANNKGAGD